MKFSIPNNIKVKEFNDKSTKKYLKIDLSLFLVLFVLMLTSCSQEPIKIGFIGDLSSKNSQLAIDARNSVELSIRLMNENGGVDGRQIELFVKDDTGNTEVALEKHQEFLTQEVKFIIGHLNSNMAKPVLESSNIDMLFVSPSMSTTALSKKDDFFIRTSPINNNQAELFTEYVIHNNLKDIVIIYDLMNEEYTKTVAENVEMIMEVNKTPIKEIIAYDTRKDELIDVAKKIIEAKPQNIFIVAQATDAAYLIQKVKQSAENIGTFSVSWSMTKDFITNGGKNVEGTIFIGVFMPETYSKDYIDFKNAFIENYGYELSFIGILAYDALNVLTQGIEASDELIPTEVKKSILDIGLFNGLYHDFNIDNYGDNDKKYMLYELNQGKFLPMRDWKD